MPIQWYNSRADLIWAGSPFNNSLTCDGLHFSRSLAAGLILMSSLATLNTLTKEGRESYTLVLVHCNGNSVYILLFWELRGLSPNFHIHVSVSDLYIPRIGPHISSSRKGRPIVGIYNSLTDT
jgi:hypothetical protein